MTVQLNLLPDVKKEYLKAQKTKALVISTSIIVTLVAVGLSILLFLYVTFGQQLQVNVISSDIKNKINQLNGIQDLDKYLTIQNQLQALPSLHNQDGAYSRLFDFLPVLNPSSPNNVQLTTLELSTTTSNQIVLTGTTATFESLNIFVDTLNNAEASYQQSGGQTVSEKIFDSVNVQSSSLSVTNGKQIVSFTINTTYNPDVFTTTNTNVKASIPNIVTTPSVTGSPQPVFQSGGQ